MRWVEADDGGIVEGDSPFKRQTERLAHALGEMKERRVRPMAAACVRSLGRCVPAIGSRAGPRGPFAFFLRKVQKLFCASDDEHLLLTVNTSC